MTILKGIVDKLVPILLSAAGFLGFVAVVGGISVWFGYYTAELPAIQAVDAMPRSELLIHGAVPLIFFGVLGIVAVAVCYAVDPGGRSRQGMLNSLVLLFGASVIGILVLTPMDMERDTWITVAVGAGAALSMGLAEWQKLPEEKTGRHDRLASEAATVQPPVRYGTSGAGLLGFAMIAAATCGAVYLLTDLLWPVLAVLAAAALAIVIFRVAEGTGNHFAPFALAVFFSLPLLGTVVNLLVLADEPLVQPVALIVRAADGGRHGIEALYVTETDSKVYLGSVATGTCGGGEIAPGSGVVYSVAKSDVDAMRVGRRQRVAEAGRAAASLLDGLVRTAGTFPDPGASPTRVSGNETDTTGQGRKPWPLRLTHDRAVRQEPRIDSVVPASAATGQRIDINGDGFGSRPGRVVVGSRPARLITWDDELIKAIVPPRARTSRIRVHCPGPHAIVTVPRR